MGTMFENLDIRRYDDHFVIIVKDRFVYDGERWVAASLTEEEAKRLYEYLKTHLE